MKDRAPQVLQARARRAVSFMEERAARAGGAPSGTTPVPTHDAPERARTSFQAHGLEATPEILLERAPEAILLLDSATLRLLYANARAVELFGHPSGQLVRMNLDELCRATGTGTLIDTVALARLQAGGTHSVACEGRHAAGHTLRCELKLLGIQLGSRHVLRASLVSEADAGVELERRSLRADALLAASGDSLIGVDARGRVEYMNPAAMRLTGWSLAAARAKPIREVLRLLDRDSGAEEPLSVCPRQGVRLAAGAQRMLVGRSGREVPVEAAAAPMRGGRGGRASGAVIVIRDARTESGLRWQLSYEARHDALTELCNRMTFEQMLAEALASAKRGEAQHAVLYIDLDQFKVINDTCGHAAGDTLIRRLSGLLRDRVRDSDALARLGGDEFGVLLRGCPLEQAIEMAGELRRMIADHRFVWRGQMFRPAASIGVVEVTDRSDSAGAVLSAADMACYSAKEEGRNRVRVCRADTVPRHQEEMLWVSRLLRAREDGRFEMYFQPIVPIRESRDEPAHYELLLRMRDESGRMVAPGEFIRAAERYNLMPSIDRWVIEHALALAPARTSDNRPPHYTLSINLSGNSLSDERFLDYVRARLLESDVAPGSLWFEITETAAITHFETAAHFMRELKKLGCLFSLDDFGRGLSSFAYLKDLPVDFLKIDGRFVRNICGDEIDNTMVDAINRVGHAMGIKTVAEHVESAEAAHKVAALGVDYAQGFAIARPAPADLENFLGLEIRFPAPASE